jgi:hypothetical protein
MSSSECVETIFFISQLNELVLPGPAR